MQTTVNTFLSIHTTMLRLVLFSLMFFPALVFSGEIIDEVRDVDANEVIDIEIINGTITIIGWDRNQVEVKGELSDQAESYEFSSRNGITRFEEEYENRRNWFGRNCSSWFECSDEIDRTELDISVPKNSTLRLEGINVELIVSGLTGNTQIEIVNGPIEANDLSGRINIETVNGSIETFNLDGRINLATVNGQIRDRGSRGERVFYNNVNGSIISNTRAQRVNAETVSGTVELNLGDIEDLEASGVNANLIISLNLLEGGRAELSNVNGYTELLVNPDISARFEINTAVGGDIDNDLTDHEPVQESRFINSQELTFSINGGAGSVDISTVTGDILIGKK